ncbi:MAG: hypothetical protein VX086_06660 [Pseudomonadota bacterium]|nr:hypothetical protein [Pseudomonadota bacterium]
MFWLIALLSSISVILILLLPAVKSLKQNTSETSAEKPEEKEIRKLQNKVNMYKIICILLAVPILTFSIYNMIGLPESINLPKISSKDNANQNFNSEEHTAQLEEVLERDSNNPKLLEQMTKVYMVRGEYEKAVEFAEKRVTVNPNDSAALTQLADAMAMLKKGNIDNEVMQILEKAISLDDSNPVALTLSGIGYKQRDQTKKALSNWNKAIANLPLNSELSARVNELIQNTEKQFPKKTQATTTEAVANIRIEIESDLLKRLNPESTLFVFLKSDERSPPLYAVKRQIPINFPASIVLKKGDSMLGNTNLKNSDKVYVVARISQSGSPLANRGDLEGRTNSFAPTLEPQKIVINKILSGD